MGDRGVVYIAFGRAARKEARLALESLRRHHPELPAVVMGEKVQGAVAMEFELPEMTNVQRSRYVKTMLGSLSPYRHTLYMDADTRAKGRLDAGFEVLEAGWDVAIVPSENQGDDLLWHIGDEEREATLVELGHVPVQLQGGVVWFSKTDATRTFFDTWHNEWQRWRDQDQGALLRALNRVPVRTWLLSRAFNGGAVVKHRFGCARK